MAGRFRTVAMLGIAVLAVGGCATPRRTAPWDAPPTGDPAADRDAAAAMAYVVRAVLAEELDRDAAAAAAAYEAAARRAPYRVDLAIRAAVARMATGQPETAIGLLRAVLPHHDDSAELQFALGHVLHKSGLGGDAARDHYRQAIRLDPVYALPYIGLASAALEAEAPEEAVRTLLQAVESGVDDARINAFLLELSKHLIDTGRYEAAHPCLRALFTLNPDTADVRRSLALIEAHLGHHDAARELLAEWPPAIEQPGLADALLAEIYETLEDRPRAIAFGLEAVAASDAPAGAWIRVGRLLLMEDPTLAAPLMAQATDRFPDMEMLWLFRGLAYSALERYRDAVTALEKAATLSESRPPELRHLPAMFDFWLGAAHERTENVEAAERHFRRSIEHHPDLHQAFNYLAYMWAEQGTNLTEALELVETALEADPDNGAYIDTLGWIYYQQARYPEALDTLQRALREMPDDPVISDHVGDALNALDRRDEAIEYWKRSYRIKPDNEEVAAKLRDAGIDLEALRTDE